MGMMEIRRNVLAFDSVMDGNIFDPQKVQPVNANYSATCGNNYIKIEKTTSTSSPYGRTKTATANLRLTPGKKYKLTTTIKDFSQSNLTGLVYISDSKSNIVAQTEQLTTVHIGDKLQMEFVYASTMTELSFYMNRSFNVSLGTYIIYGDILILEIA